MPPTKKKKSKKKEEYVEPISDKYTFEVSEIVWKYHGPMLYKAKVLKRDIQKNEHGESVPFYFVHYHGWNSCWDDWVEGNNLIKDSSETEELSKKLLQEFKGKPIVNAFDNTDVYNDNDNCNGNTNNNNEINQENDNKSTKKLPKHSKNKKKNNSDSLPVKRSRSKSPSLLNNSSRKQSKKNDDEHNNNDNQDDSDDDDNNNDYERNKINIPLKVKENLVKQYIHIVEDKQIIPLPKKENYRVCDILKDVLEDYQNELTKADNKNNNNSTINNNDNNNNNNNNNSNNNDNNNNNINNDNNNNISNNNRPSNNNNDDEIKKVNREREIQQFQDILCGIEGYFNKCLYTKLLFKNELVQAKNLQNDYKNKLPSYIYGSEHLARFFVKFPVFLEESQGLKDEYKKMIISKSYILLSYLHKNHHKLFLNPSNYEKVSDEYERSTNYIKYEDLIQFKTQL